MMAALYVLMTWAVGSIYVGKRKLAVILLLVAMAGFWLMLWHHATDTLKINW